MLHVEATYEKLVGKTTEREKKEKLDLHVNSVPR
jgi:hypothetical protein